MSKWKEGITSEVGFGISVGQDLESPMVILYPAELLVELIAHMFEVSCTAPCAPLCTSTYPASTCIYVL